MARSAKKIDIRADRWTACQRQLALIDINVPTGSIFHMQVRLTPDAPGDPLIDLNTVSSAASQGVYWLYTGTDTILNHMAAGRLREVPLGYQQSDPILLSLIGFMINATTMQGLPFPQERGDNQVFVWDMLIAPLVTGAIREKYAGGLFIAVGGATQ